MFLGDVTYRSHGARNIMAVEAINILLLWSKKVNSFAQNRQLRHCSETLTIRKIAC
jgi:hypothetical protein